MLKYDYKSFTKLFFSRHSEVLRGLNAGLAAALSRAGAIVMRRARGLIQKRGKARRAPKITHTKKGRERLAAWRQEVAERPPSPPGSPPYTYTGIFPRTILFGYEPASRQVLVGAVKLRGEGAASWLEEFGGFIRRARRAPRRGHFTAHYPPRPYMAPGLRLSLPQIPGQFREILAPGSPAPFNDELL